ncbi:hypothetical protein [Zavarzinella formosa]|uniref:hypothetical protein n=1 Tax=Zavarzinella formosa TaxID=360055 RepID=UPI0012FB6B39|nr:hypothetical protein [Zavarzinella formosa]
MIAFKRKFRKRSREGGEKPGPEKDARDSAEYFGIFQQKCHKPSGIMPILFRALRWHGESPENNFESQERSGYSRRCAWQGHDDSPSLMSGKIKLILRDI